MIVDLPPHTTLNFWDRFAKPIQESLRLKIFNSHFSFFFDHYYCDFSFFGVLLKWIRNDTIRIILSQSCNFASHLGEFFQLLDMYMGVSPSWHLIYYRYFMWWTFFLQIANHGNYCVFFFKNPVFCDSSSPFHSGVIHLCSYLYRDRWHAKLELTFITWLCRVFFFHRVIFTSDCVRVYFCVEVSTIMAPFWILFFFCMAGIKFI